MRTTALIRTVVYRLLFTAPLALAGCWTAPVANVQPKGEPRLIQADIPVRSVRSPVIVESVDPGARTMVLRMPDGAQASTYKVSPAVSDLDRFRPGDKVRATVTEELSVYVLRDGQLPGTDGAAQTIAVNAKVLSVDPSYRLLTLQYPDGQNETFKVGLDGKLREMEAGDAVVIRPVEVVALKDHTRWPW
jgi:hypothetical protein